MLPLKTVRDQFRSFSLEHDRTDGSRVLFISKFQTYQSSNLNIFGIYVKCIQAV